jgi:hypothetical protein
LAITYTPTTNFGAKDSLPSNDPDKVIKGSEFSVEFTAIQTAFSLAAPVASPTFTGTVTIPTADINGGNIDGAIIGAATPAAGSFTTGSFTGDVTFGDSDKAIFGAGSDLQIYHSGTHSFISDQGTGNMLVLADNFEVNSASNTANKITAATGGAVTLFYNNAAKLATTATGIDVTGTVTADGLTVDGAGTAVFSGGQYIRVDGDAAGVTDLEPVLWARSKVGASIPQINVKGSQWQFGGGGTLDANPAMTIDYASGDISFYEDTGTTPKFFWDASAESLSVGATAGTTDRRFQVTGSGVSSSTSQFGIVANPTFPTAVTASVYNLYTGPNLTSGTTLTNLYNLYLESNNKTGSTVTNSYGLYQAGSGDKNYFAGSVGIGTSSPAYTLDTNTASAGTIARFVNGAGRGYVRMDGYDDMTLQFYRRGASVGFFQTDASGTEFLGGTTGAYPLVLYTNNTERMRIDSSGRLLVGISTPVGTEQVLIASSSAGSQPQQLNLKDTNASANGNYFLVARKSDDTYVGGLRRSGTDTALAVDGTAHLAFQISGTEVGRFDGSGNLLVGTTTQSGQITVDNGGNNTGVYVHQSSSSVNHTGISVKSSYVTGGQTGTMVRFIQTSDATVGTISSTTTATAYNTSSDARLKENIADAEDAASLIDAIQVRSFDWKADGSHQRYGMVAQELLEVAPEAVSGDPESDDMMGVDYSKLVPMLVKEIQSLRARVAQLEGA